MKGTIKVTTESYAFFLKDGTSLSQIFLQISTTITKPRLSFMLRKTIALDLLGYVLHNLCVDLQIHSVAQLHFNLEHIPIPRYTHPGLSHCPPDISLKQQSCSDILRGITRKTVQLLSVAPHMCGLLLFIMRHDKEMRNA